MAKWEKEKRTERIEVRTTPQIRAAAEQRAQEEGRALSNYIEQLIREDIKKNG